MHVLVVDDNLLSRTQIISQVRRAGWEVTAVEADPGALARLDGRRPDSVIVNLGGSRPPLPPGPDADGEPTAARPAAFVRALRRTPSWHDVPVLGFCGHADRARWREGLAAGCTKVASNAAVASDVAELLGVLHTSRADHRGGQSVT